MARVLALDIGNVCLKLTYSRACEALGATEEIRHSPAWEQLYVDYSIGLIGSHEFKMRLHAITGCPLDDIREGWRKFLGEEIVQTTQMVERLWREGWKVVFLSDIQPWHIDDVRAILPYAMRVTDAVFSCDVGCLKPDDGMYAYFEEHYGKPDLYLDDKIGNIEAARKRGWYAVQVRWPEPPDVDWGRFK